MNDDDYIDDGARRVRERRERRERDEQRKRSAAVAAAAAAAKPRIQARSRCCCGARRDEHDDDLCPDGTGRFRYLPAQPKRHSMSFSTAEVLIVDMLCDRVRGRDPLADDPDFQRLRDKFQTMRFKLE